MSRNLTTVEVADICRTSPETVRYWRHLGTYGPPSFKVGRRVLYDSDDVERWLAGLKSGKQAAGDITDNDALTTGALATLSASLKRGDTATTTSATAPTAAA